MPRQKKPGYWSHKPSGQAYVRIDGKDHYLGPYDSAESRDRYDELIREWVVNQSAEGVTLAVDELALRYLKHARQHYRKNGEETSEVSSIMAAPLTPSQKARKPKAKPAVTPGERYTVASYGSAVRKGCEKAFDMPRELRNVSTKLPAAEREGLKAQARAWREAHAWHPHQIRHTAATEIRRTFGLEAAQVALGHASADVTQLYAERDLELARQVAAKLG